MRLVYGNFGRGRAHTLAHAGGTPPGVLSHWRHFCSRKQPEMKTEDSIAERLDTRKVLSDSCGLGRTTGLIRDNTEDDSSENTEMEDQRFIARWESRIVKSSEPPLESFRFLTETTPVCVLKTPSCVVRRPRRPGIR